MVKIMSWNTLESGEGGAWSNGWGCPLEIQRREGLMKAINKERGYNESAVVTKSEAERILTLQRYNRIRKTMLEEIRNSNTTSEDNIDIMLFQECTTGDFWDEPSHNPGNEDSLDHDFFQTFRSSYQKVPCQMDTNEDDNIQDETLQHVYVRRNSGWVPSLSLTLQSKALVGGCLIEFLRCEVSETRNNCLDRAPPTSLVVVNLHGKSRNMRDPDLRRQGILDLWEEIGSHLNDYDDDGGGGDISHDNSSWKSRIVLCGDWNTQLSDLIEPFREANSESLLEPVVGLLDNATATTDYPFFSTNHEDGFLAQYDGCLFFHKPPVLGSSEESPSYLQLEGMSWNITGFMPKGRDGRLSGNNPGATTMYNNFTYYHGSNNSDNDDKEEGVYLNGVFLPGSMPSMGLSDHLRIYTKIHIDRNNNTKKNNETIDDEQLPSQTQQRRPYHNDDGDDSSSVHSSSRGGFLLLCIIVFVATSVFYVVG